MCRDEVGDFDLCLPIVMLVYNFTDMHDGPLKNAFPLSVGNPFACLCRIGRMLRLLCAVR